MARNAHAFQWILGALLAGSATTVAVAAPPATPAPGSVARSSTPAPPPARAAGSGAGTPQVAAAAPTPLPAGQVWQCVINGERIFSDAPCGEHASIRQLRELNVMDAPPMRSYGYAYPSAPPSEPAPAFAPAPPDDSDYADPWGPGVLWAHGYARRNYFTRRDNHIHPQPQAHPHAPVGRH